MPNSGNLMRVNSQRVSYPTKKKYTAHSNVDNNQTIPKQRKQSRDGYACESGYKKV
jgi:hypothetical protein